MIKIALSLFATLAVAQTWTTVQPGGDTSCHTGSYAFFFRFGTVNKLLVEYEGGGGCWDVLTCGLVPTYKTSVNVDSTLRSLNSAVGIQDHDNDENPFREWTHVYVPYCSGDLFAGDVYANYGVYHKGWSQGRSVLSWITENIKSPEQIMITGCSAGGYGAHFWAPLIMQQYPAADSFHFGDSAMGVFARSQMEGSLDTWGLDKFLLQGVVPAYEDLDWTFEHGYVAFASDLLSMAANQFSNATFSAFTSTADTVQLGFYNLGLEELMTPAGFGEAVRDIFDESINKAEANNMYGWISRGGSHCIIVSNSFYTQSVDGILLTTWLRDMITHRPIRQLVDCRDDGSC